MGSYLGQNFLTDAKIKHAIADKIASLYSKQGCTALLEIGPGKGALTKLIQHISPNFFVIEKDTVLKPHLLALDLKEDETLFFGDVLDIDVQNILQKKGLVAEKTLVVGNLPYYITSPIFRKFFGYGLQEFAGGVFMIQKEVADKISTVADKKSYLWWLLNYAYEVKYLKTVPAKAFSPAPKVTSAVVGFAPLSSECFPKQMKFEHFVGFLDDFAPFSRKTLGAIAKMVNKKHEKEEEKKAKKNKKSDTTDTETIFHERKIPSEFSGKRLEECTWDSIEAIVGN